jgi:hypothetical protein
MYSMPPTSMPVVDHVLDAADVDAGGLHDRLAGANDLWRRGVAFHLEAGLRRVHRAGAPHEFDAISALADVGGAEVERLAGREDLDRVEILAA